MAKEGNDLDFLGNLARKAGEAILEVYDTDFEVERKEDSSPLTLADQRSHRLIAAELQSRYPDIPVLSEEGKEAPYHVRKAWPSFWLVDPLDGTKEFVKRNGEFSVNIALIEGTTPVIGVIYLPVLDRLYVAHIRQGCREIAQGKSRRLRVGDSLPAGTIRVLKSRSHPSPNLEALLEILPSHESVIRGSALKFCAIAAGEADFYPRLGPTWEWDTAAGQAIVSAAGGVMVDLDGKPFTYNKPNLVNGPFLVASSGAWLKQSGILEKALKLSS
jgi:3'(2'), 5'-bisphosphate nucleotidase